MATLKDLTVLGPARFLDKIYGNLEGNASTASKLSPGATINGTTFTGGANITTSYWGTTKTLTIGNKGQSVNGSANVAWSLSEIGAVNKAGDTMSGNLTTTHASGGETSLRVTHGSNEFLYLWGNNSSGTRGLYDTTKGYIINVTDTSATFTGYLSGNISGYASYVRDKFNVDTSNAKSIMEFYDSDNSTLHATMGIHNTGSTYGAIYIIPYPTTEDPWNGNEGLYIAKNKLKLDSNIVPTTGNTSGTVGSSIRPVYVNAGVITATSYTAVGYGGTGTTTAPTQGGVIYASSTSAYASTAAGTSGQLLQSAGTGKPTWITATNSNTANTIVKRDESGNFSAGTITASLSGNASTATKLATARTISLTGDASGSISFDGSANKTITVVIADDSHNHVIGNIDGLQDALDKKVSLNGTGATGTWGISITGNAETADKLFKKVTLGVNLASNNFPTFDGSANVNAIGVSGILGVGNGGTGATTKLNAKTNLGITYGTALPSSGSEGDIFFVLAS